MEVVYLPVFTYRQQIFNLEDNCQIKLPVHWYSLMVAKGEVNLLTGEVVLHQ